MAEQMEVKSEENKEEVIDQMAELEAQKKSKIKIFGLYDVSEVKVEDPGLKRVIDLEPMTVLKTHGRIRGKFSAAKINLVERLIRALSNPGDRKSVV